MHRVTSDADRLRESTSRQKGQLDVKERQISEIGEKERQSKVRVLELQTQLKESTDECWMEQEQTCYRRAYQQNSGRMRRNMHVLRTM